MTANVPVVLRPGAVTLADLQRIVPTPASPSASDDVGARPGRATATTRPAPASGSSTRPSRRPTRPTSGSSAAAGLRARRDVRSVEAYARAAFDLFRRADALGAARIDAQRVPDDGLGRALMDRLRRAAQG